VTAARPKSFASVVLKHALRTVAQRGATHGPIDIGFRTIARLWSVVLGTRVEPWQVALCLDAMKTARVMHAPGHLDSWVDKCGYSAIGAELAPVDQGIGEPPEQRICGAEEPDNLDGGVYRCAKPFGHRGAHAGNNAEHGGSSQWPNKVTS
jgi:hypothetical protein